MKYLRTYENFFKKNSLFFLFDDIESLIKYILPDVRVIKAKHKRVESSIEITSLRVLPKIDKDESVLDKSPFDFARFYVRDDRILICIFKNTMLDNLLDYLVYKIKNINGELRKDYYDAIEYFVPVSDIKNLLKSISKEDFELFDSSNKYNL